MSMVEPSYVASTITGILYGILAWFPVALNGSFTSKVLSSIDPNLINHIVPAYLGMMVAVLFYFRGVIERTLQVLSRRQSDPELRFLFYASLFTIVVGYPLYAGLSTKLSSSQADTANALISILIATVALLNLEKKSHIQELESGMRESVDEPTLMDSIFTGIAQGMAFIGGLSRTGMAMLPLMLSGINVRKVLELSFLLAPVYLFLRLMFVRSYTPVSPMDSFAVFTASFIGSIITMHLLLKLADKSGRKGVGSVFGVVAVSVYVLGVIV